jgi:DNA sulfur modification protein DndD
MKILSLTLNNIGAYYGRNHLDLSVKSQGRNIVLFGGRNGAGKTTILESIRIALFGPLAFGLRTETETYFQQIQRMLNKKAVTQGKNIYQIDLVVSQIENFERSEYEISRLWEYRADKLKEHLVVKKNGFELSSRETEVFQSKIREEIPPHLFELCLFDGEEISRIVSEGRLAEYLQMTSRVLFNLDLFENLEKDLLEYKTVLAQKLDTTADEKRLQELEEKLVSNRERRIALEREIERNQSELAEEESKLTQIKKEFEIHGGLRDENRSRLISEEKAIEEQRRANSEKIKEFIANVLPFYLTRTLLEETWQQMEKEQELEAVCFFRRRWNLEQAEKLADRLKQKGIQMDGDAAGILLEAVQMMFEADLLEPIHQASSVQRSEVYTMLSNVKELDPREIISLYEENQHLLAQAQQIRKQLEENDRTHDFQRFISEMEQSSRQIEQLSIRLEQLREELAMVEQEIMTLEKDRDRIRKKLMESDRSESSLLLSSNIIEISQKFRDMQNRKKLKQVEIEAIKMLKRLFRKTQFVHDLVIDPVSMELTLYDELGGEIIKERLSSGEKELLMISVIWAMFKVSGRKLPFVFDTLLGRLDTEHRKALVEKFLPVCGEQVIVLSTDSEIDRELYQQLQHYVSSVYTLEHDPKEQQVVITQGTYFNFSGVNVFQ